MTHVLDINLICRNNGLNFQRTLDCLSNQTFKHFKVTVIDDGSTDSTPELVKKHAEKDPRFSHTWNEKRLYVGNFQRAFWVGDAEFVMPKSSDDLLDETYVEKCMNRIREDDDLVMVHTQADVIDDMGNVTQAYPPEANLKLLEDDPFTRSLKMAATYTFAPTYWGVYRRSAVSKLAPIPYCNGFDHIVVCELALYGKTDAVEEVLFHRARGAAPLAENAKKATLQHVRDLSIDTITANFSYFTPMITMIIGHVEMARLARIQEEKRPAYIDRLISVLVERFDNNIKRELEYFKAQLGNLSKFVASPNAPQSIKLNIKRELSHHILGMEMVLGGRHDLGVFHEFRHDICKDIGSN